MTECVTKRVPYTTCHFVKECRTKRIPYCTMRLEKQCVTKRIPYCTCKKVCVTEMVTETKCVPRQVTYKEIRCVPRTVCRTVACPGCPDCCHEGCAPTCAVPGETGCVTQ